jgi:GNAT superfamily N-acetyltransferase
MARGEVLGRELLNAFEEAAARAGAHTITLGADEAQGFYVRCGWTPPLLLQWAYDPGSLEAEAEAVLAGAALGRPHERRSHNGVPQLFVELASGDR